MKIGTVLRTFRQWVPILAIDKVSSMRCKLEEKSLIFILNLQKSFSFNGKGSFPLSVRRLATGALYSLINLFPNVR